MFALREKGIKDPRVLEAFEKVDRERFVPSYLKERAYEDTALPLMKGQTISQPYTIAVMLEMLRLKEGLHVLEIGTGSGYSGTLIHYITRRTVYSLEYFPELADYARERAEGVHIVVGDGKLGLPRYSPYERIVVHAASSKVPRQLVKQLKEGGILVLPLGEEVQDLVAFRKEGGELKEVERREGFVFVPLL